MTRLLGVDVGDRRIGLAVADTESGTVRPLATIRRSGLVRDARTLTRICDEQRIDELVIGLPLNMDGSEGSQAGAARAWAAALAGELNRPIFWRDERLTSEAAERRVAAPRGRAGGPPSAAARNARRARIDREAAAAIVQAELDARRSS